VHGARLLYVGSYGVAAGSIKMCGKGLRCRILFARSYALSVQILFPTLAVRQKYCLPANSGHGSHAVAGSGILPAQNMTPAEIES
jgi:hypothetical protein